MDDLNFVKSVQTLILMGGVFKQNIL